MVAPIDTLNEGNVAKPLRGHEQNTRALALQQSVRSYGGSEDQRRESLGWDLRFTDHADQRFLRILREDGHLATTRSPVVSSSATRSVNVPPVSMPHRNCVGRLITGLERSAAPDWLRGAGDASASGPWEEQILYVRLHLYNVCRFKARSLAACSITIVTERRSRHSPRWPHPRSNVQRYGLSSSPAGACSSQGVRESRMTQVERLHHLLQVRR